MKPDEHWNQMRVHIQILNQRKTIIFFYVLAFDILGSQKLGSFGTLLLLLLFEYFKVIAIRLVRCDL